MLKSVFMSDFTTKLKDDEKDSDMLLSSSSSLAYLSDFTTKLNGASFTKQ